MNSVWAGAVPVVILTIKKVGDVWILRIIAVKATFSNS